MIAIPEWGSLGVFVAAALLLLVTPGPAVLYIVARSVDQGRAAGLVSALGVHAGTLVHIVAAAAGLSVLLAASAALFNLVKYLGAAYLVFLGVRRILDRAPPGGPGQARAIPWRRALLDGAIVNALNPKTALFFLAFLPQFVDPIRGPVGPQVLALGLVFVMLGLVTDGLYAIAAGSARRWILAASPRFMTGQRWVTGAMYIGLGVAAAFTDARAETCPSGSLPPGRSAL
jgi:threonine/homoserine/homoserine lactone efflux protein